MNRKLGGVGMLAATGGEKMTDRDHPGWEKDFPRREEFEDFSGKMRTFIVDCHEGPLGYTIRAREENPKGEGYEFAVYSETSPYSALGRLPDKARRSMATRHLSSGHNMLHDMLRGRITADGQGGVVLVFDGLAISIDKLTRLLAAHEGWEFELRIKDALQ
jgi:hypothetical protein